MIKKGYIMSEENLSVPQSQYYRPVTETMRKSKNCFHTESDRDAGTALLWLPLGILAIGLVIFIILYVGDYIIIEPTSFWIYIIVISLSIISLIYIWYTKSKYDVCVN